jgi:hypothetical protein
MYEHASRLTTWDLPAIRAHGEKFIDKRAQVKMSHTSDGFWLVHPSECVENYGYNSIKLNAPPQAVNVQALFKGKIGAKGFRDINTDKGGWRYGFVALLDNGARKYSQMGTAVYKNGNNPHQTLTFSCPGNCIKLWFVVSGAPQQHWRHPWDDDNSNDEHWPYEVQFLNTNLLGEKTERAVFLARKEASLFYLNAAAETIRLPGNIDWRITNLAGRRRMSGYGNSIDLNIPSNGMYVLNYSGKHLKIRK